MQENGWILKQSCAPIKLYLFAHYVIIIIIIIINMWTGKFFRALNL